MVNNCLDMKTVTVDYERSYLEMIKPNMTHDNAKRILSQKPSWEILQIPMMPTGKKELAVSFRCSDPGVRIPTIINELRLQHQRPAIMTEFMFVLKTLAEQENTIQLACLGSLWRDPVDFWLPATQEGVIKLLPLNPSLQQQIIFPTVYYSSSIAKVPLSL